MENSERKLIEKAKQGDSSALLCLYNQYLPMFKKLCRNKVFYVSTLEVSDLQQECFIALKLATRHYNFEQGTDFITYLYTTTKRHLNKVVTKNSHLSEFQLGMILKIKIFREKYLNEFGKLPGNRLVMREFDLSADFLEELDTLKDLKAISLDVPTSENDDCTLADLLPNSEDLENEVVKRLSIAQFWELLENCLLPEELEIIKMIYLDRLPVKRIGAILGRSETQVRTIQARSLKKLRMKQELKEKL